MITVTSEEARVAILRGTAPDGLTVDGSLFLGGCTGLTRLPEDLMVKGRFDLGGCIGLWGTPRTPNQQKALVAVAEIALQPGALFMARWHTCETTHCIAGWAQHLSDDPVIKALDPSFAGYLLLGADAATRFYLSTDQALDWLRSVLEDEGVTA